VKRIDQYRAKLKAAKAEKKIRQREFNIISRALCKVTDEIDNLNRKIEDESDKKLAAITANTKSTN
jgi:hypothetical protein